MRDTSATPQGDATTDTRPTTKARVIPIDGNSEAMSLFSSEQKAAKADVHPAVSTEATHAAPVPLLPPEHPAPKTTEIARPTQVAKQRRFGTREMLMTVLALVVVGEGGYIAYSMYMSRAAVAPETGSVTVTS